MLISSMISLSQLYLTTHMLLLSWTWVSRTILLHPLLTFISRTDLSSKLSIMQSMLHQLRLSSLLLYAVSIRLLIYLIYQKSLLLLTPSMWQDLSSTLLSICSKYTQLLSPKNSEGSSSWTMTTWLSSGNVLVIVTGHSSSLLTKIPNSFVKYLYFSTNHYRTLARKESLRTLFKTGKWHSRH